MLLFCLYWVSRDFVHDVFHDGAGVHLHAAVIQVLQDRVVEVRLRGPLEHAQHLVSLRSARFVLRPGRSAETSPLLGYNTNAHVDQCGSTALETQITGISLCAVTPSKVSQSAYVLF